MSDAKADDVVPCVSSPRVTGADIPEELFEHILWHVINRVVDTDLFTLRLFPSGGRDFHALRSLALVCRYFASVCRPKLYRAVVIRSHRRLEGLLDLLRSGITPLGKFLLEFTHEFDIGNAWESKTEDVADDFKRKDLSWTHRLGTTLYPMLKNAGIRIPDVTLRLNTNPPFCQLPRTMPSSTFQHVRLLRLRGVQFQGGEDLLRYISSFRHLDQVSLDSCTYEPVTPPAAIFLPSRRDRSWPKVQLFNSSTLAPLMVTELLARYARTNSIPFLSREQEEAQTLVNTVRALNDSRSRVKLTKWTLGMHHVHAGNTLQLFFDASFSMRRPPVGLYVEILDRMHYDILLEIRHPLYGVDIDLPLESETWRETAGYIAHLSHLNTLKWSFQSPTIMWHFYLILQELHATGKAMKFRIKDPSRAGGFSDWEPTSAILEPYSPDPEAEAPVEDQETEVTDEEAESGSTEPIESAGMPVDDAAVALLERLDL